MVVGSPRESQTYVPGPLLFQALINDLINKRNTGVGNFAADGYGTEIISDKVRVDKCKMTQTRGAEKQSYTNMSFELTITTQELYFVIMDNI